MVQSGNVSLVASVCGQETWSDVSTHAKGPTVQVTSLSAFTCYQFKSVQCGHQSPPTHQILTKHYGRKNHGLLGRDMP